jgi:hypothetical protein
MFREPTSAERALLARLLEAEFPGKLELARLLRNILVRSIDADGGIEIKSQSDGKATVVKRVPVEAEGKDEDGTVIHMLSHVADGRTTELEFFREDGTMVKRLPTPSEFELIVLPPMPRKGWSGPC